MSQVVIFLGEPSQCNQISLDTMKTVEKSLIGTEFRTNSQRDYVPSKSREGRQLFRLVMSHKWY